MERLKLELNEAKKRHQAASQEALKLQHSLSKLQLEQAGEQEQHRALQQQVTDMVIQVPEILIRST